MSDNQLILLDDTELRLRVDRLTSAMTAEGIDLGVIHDNATKFYLTGRVFAGTILVRCDGRMICCVQRTVHLSGHNVITLRKPEEMPARLPDGFMSSVSTVGYEYMTLSVADYKRLSAIFDGYKSVDLSKCVRVARSVKTPVEVDMIAESGRRQTEVYSHIPELYSPGMTDIQLQIELERQLRLAGCLGQFRIAGNSMELFMGNIIAGDNADNPTPYDFAMGGEGMHPSLPVGANGTLLTPGMTVMIDANGNFTGYMTDMTRTYSVGDVPPEAHLAHQVSVEICDALSAAACPGVECSHLYGIAVSIVEQAGLTDYFMGHRLKAGFVGHGLGIEINEMPVIAPRSRDIIEAGNVFALEPKFVIPGVGAVGIENTYLVMPDRSESATRCLTNAPTPLVKI